MRGILLLVLWPLLILGLFAIFVLSGTVTATLATCGIVVLSFALELVDSSLGMGYGTTLTPILLLFGYEPLDLVPTILVSEFLSGFTAALFHAEAGNVQLRRGTRHQKAAVLLSAFGLVGTLVGVEVALSIPGPALRTLIGAVILASGILILVSHRTGFTFRRWKVACLGLVASFNKAVSGGGYGPLMTSGQILSGLEARAAVGITSLAEGFTCLTGSVAFLLRGQSLDPELLLPVVTGALLSVPISARIVKRVPEHGMKRVVAGATMAMGLFIVVKAAL